MIHLFKINNMKKSICPDLKTAHLSVALYSISQNCFHIEELHQYIELNIRNALHKVNKNDYRLIGVFNNDIEADEYIEAFRIKINK